MQNYEPPVLACAVAEILSQISGEESSSKLKWESKTLTHKKKKKMFFFFFTE